MNAHDTIQERFLRGEDTAYGEVARWIARVLTYPRYRLLRREWTDLHQEILRRVVESLRSGRFDPALDFGVYVRTIARYTAGEALRRRLRGAAETEFDPARAAADGGSEEPLVTRDLARAAMSRVPSSCRRLFEMFFYDQTSYAEMATRLDIPVGTVKSRLFRCLRQAYEKLVLPAAARTGPRAGAN